MHKICNVIVGLPASGKSTLTELSKNDCFVYSTDAYIESVAKKVGKTYSQVFTETAKTAEWICEAGLTIAMEDNQSVIWDQTNLGVNKRKKIINRMTREGYKMICYCFLPPETDDDVAELTRRLGNRPGKVIPPATLDSMKSNYVVPTHDEGFTEMYYLNIKGDLVDYKG
jgi:predicted kinase